MYNRKHVVLFAALVAFSSIAAATGTVTVSVEDNNGNSVSKADVILYQNDYDRVGDAWTGDQGSVTFNVESSASGSIDYRATSTKKCYNTDSGEATIDYIGDSETIDLQINRYEPQGELTVNVLNNGNLVSGATVILDGRVDRESTTDSSGSVEFTELPHGSYDVKANIDTGFGKSSTKTKTFKIDTCGPDAGDWTEGEKTFKLDFKEINEAPNIQLERPSSGDTISLPYTFEWNVDDPDGDSIEENSLVIEQGGSTVEIEDVGSSEEFTAEEGYLEPGDYTWYVESEDVNGNSEVSDSRSFTVEETESEQGTLEAHVEDDEGDSLEAAEVTVDGESDSTNSNGDVSFNLAAGTYDVEATCNEELVEEEVTIESGETTNTNIEFNEDFDPNNCENDDDETGTINVLVEDEDGDPIEDAKVTVDNGNWFSAETDDDGEVSFEQLEEGTIELEASKDGYETEEEEVSLSAGETEDVEFELEREGDTGDSDEDEAVLEVHVEDDDYDDLEDAKVTVENGDDEIGYTGDDGDAHFELEPDNYDIEVECNDETEYRDDVDLDEGDEEEIDIRFDEDFESHTCGEDDKDEDYPDSDSDDDNEKGLAITDIDYPNSVCRGGSFRAEVEVENRGGFHELVTITGSGLGSINIGQSFSLDIAETKSASVRFTDVEGSGSEQFDIRATNHDSDDTTETINVRDCGIDFPNDDYDGGRDYDSASTGVTAEVSPDQTVLGKAVKVQGYVDGVRGRAQLTIRANGERKARIATEPDGYYSTYIRVDEVGDNIIRVSSGQVETSDVVTVVPTSSISGLEAPDKVFESETFEICAQINSQVEPKLFLEKNGEIVDSKFGNGEVCFNKEASGTGEHEFQIKTLTYGKQSTSSTQTVEVLELGSEVTNFPDQIATVESESGMVKVELYNTHNDSRRYQVKLNGIRTNWLSQSQEEVFLTKGERETVYFYLTPEDEGSFEPVVTVVSNDTTIYSEEVSVWAGGTKTSTNTSFFDRLSQIFSL